MYSSTYTDSLLDQCDFSDAESVVDSLIDSLANSPAPSLDDWCEQTLHDIDTDIDFQDLLVNPLDIPFGYHYDNNSPLNLPMNYEQQTFHINPINTTQQSINIQHQQQHLQQHCQQQPRNFYPNTNIYNTYHQTNADSMYPGNSTPPRLVQANNNYNNINSNIPSPNPTIINNTTKITNNNNNNSNNINAFEEMFQNQMEMFNARSSFLNNNSNSRNENDVFHLNRSTMDNRSQILFLDLIKQQQQQQELLSNQSSPPPTPSSDWADIPSPCSPTRNMIKSEFVDKKDLRMPLTKNSNTNNGSLDDDLKFPSSNIKIKDIKKELDVTKPTKPKRKRASRKQYTPSSDKPRLYKFLRQILDDPDTYRCIEWVDKSVGTFKFLDSSEVARLWGLRKNKPSMKYENFARSLRTYIAKGILKKPRNKLVYCFAQPNE